MAIVTAMRQPARLERAGRQSPFVLDQDFAGAELLAIRGIITSGVIVSPSETMSSVFDRQQFAIAPKDRRPVCQRLLAQRLRTPARS